MFRKLSLLAILTFLTLGLSGCYVSSHSRTPVAAVTPAPVVVAAQRPATVYYFDGPHPVFDIVGNSDWCGIRGPHTHTYRPDSMDFFIVDNNRYIFVGDPSFYVTSVTFDTYLYMGVHPLPFGNQWCYIDGPHRHTWPSSGYYRFTRVGNRNYFTYYGPFNNYFDPRRPLVNLTVFYTTHPPMRFRNTHRHSVGMNRPHQAPPGGSRPGQTVTRPGQPVVRPVPPIATLPPGQTVTRPNPPVVRPVPPIGTVPPVRPVPPIGEATRPTNPNRPDVNRPTNPVRPVPPIGEVTRPTNPNRPDVNRPTNPNRPTTPGGGGEITRPTPGGRPEVTRPTTPGVGGEVTRPTNPGVTRPTSPSRPTSPGEVTRPTQQRPDVSRPTTPSRPTSPTTTPGRGSDTPTGKGQFLDDDDDDSDNSSGRTRSNTTGRRSR